MMEPSFPKEQLIGDETERESRDSGAPSPARLESFSDNVISVIITIMVLDLRLPARDGLSGMREVISGFGIYMLSFSFTGIYWLNYQQLTRRLRAAGYYFQIANLAFLFCLSLLPFSTSYLINRNATPYSVQQYAATLLVIAVAFYSVRQAVHTHLELHGRMNAIDRRVNTKHQASLLIYLVCVLLAAWHPKIAVLVLGCNTGVWSVPGLDRRLLRKPPGLHSKTETPPTSDKPKPGKPNGQ